jgi:hypothetical protein
MHRIVEPVVMPSLRRLSAGAALCLLTICLGGCHSGAPRSTSVDRTPFASIQFSPNAEPLTGGPLGHPKCEEALTGWFDRVDTNHDGVIDRDEFLADARLQFNRMDRHHAGYVTAFDLSEFRAPYESPPGSDAYPPESDRRGGVGSADGPNGHPGGSGGGSEDRARAMLLQRGPSVDTRADPVMSADKTLSFKVTLEDFVAQANDVFNGLDAAHDGRVTRSSVLAICEKPK